MSTPCALITRPAGQADGLLHALAQRGWDTLHVPTLAIEPLPVTASMTQLAQDLDLYQTVIFVSANAARFGMNLFDQYWPQWPVGIEWLAVGKATQAALTEFDITATAPEQADSEGLLALPQLQTGRVDGSKILIVRGEGGRETLAETLRERGAKVTYLELYKRAEVSNIAHWQQQLFSRPFDVITCTSGDALKGLLQLWGEHTPPLTEKTLFVVSHRLANYAATLGFTNIIQTNGATDEAIIAALEHWKQP
ncbi:MAG TPA: uroporphyrinogen-III synthase [Pseudomonadales bacterium]|nr:uroporphyrinogen-III synthase [Pseudomonadales bacterium]